MKATINTAPKSTREFKIGDIVIDHNDGHVVLITEVDFDNDEFSGITLVECTMYGINRVCKMIDNSTFDLFVGTITLEN